MKDLAQLRDEWRAPPAHIHPRWLELAEADRARARRLRRQFNIPDHEPLCIGRPDADSDALLDEYLAAPMEWVR